MATAIMESLTEFIDDHNVKKSKENWRINMLARPKYYRPKFDYPEYEYQPSVRATTLTVECTKRNDDISKAFIRRLKENKKDYNFLGPPYFDIMDKKIKESWNTVYNYYNRAKKELEIKKSKQSVKSKKSSSSQKSKKSKEEKLKEIEEWVTENAHPKKQFPPDPVDRGGIVKIEEIKAHLDEIAAPKKLSPDYLPPRELPLKIEAALQYEITERVIEIAKPLPSRSLPQKPLGVSPAALHYNPSPRILEMARPKTAAVVLDNDLKENPFTISPAALKYVATPRIIELAKPVERD